MLLIKNATIWAMNGSEPFVGDIKIGKDGKISAIGGDLGNSAETVVDATGLNAFPGLVDAHTHIGGMDFSNPAHKDDYNEMSAPLKTDVNALYGCDVRCMDLDYARRHGITTICVTPGSGNVLNGTAAVIKTYGDNVFDMAMVREYALKVAFGGNPKRTYGKRDQAPASRMAIPAMIRELFTRGKEYHDDIRAGKEREYDAELEALLPLFDKKMPLKMHCTQYDMLTAIELATEFGLDFSLEHAWGAKDYLDEIQASGCSICFGPVGSLKRPGECSVIDIETVAELDRRGVLTALITDAPILSCDSLIQHAGEAVRAGLSPLRAMAMITSNAARILGVYDRVGSLETGKDGDVVLFEGTPSLDTAAKPVRVFGLGKEIRMERNEK